MAERVVDPTELDALAQALWERLPAGSVMWLSGDLGSGKTTLVQALTRAAGAATATSPTYALIQTYPSPEGPIVHVDCYRLRDPAEARDLDLAELRRGARLVCVEWPERGGGHIPPADVHVRLRYGRTPDTRIVEVAP